MNGRLLDDTNDVFLDPATHCTGRAFSLVDRIKRDIGTLLRTFEGECFVDGGVGIPWFDDVLGNSVLFADEINGELRDKILEIPGVQSVDTLNVTISGRNISGRYRVLVSDGSNLSGTF